MLAEASRLSISGGQARAGRGALYLERCQPGRLALGRYDSSQTLIIDPVLAYSTYLGGSLDDRVEAVALDFRGDVYLAGATNSPDFPQRHPLPALNNALRGDANAFSFSNPYLG
ncbi:MAG: SBBP repeat-containing protein [Verrucomicrobia bacterium]|nr:SBBP repeat-containing protein [Verrucomicrobiota bacterium]